MPEVDEVHISVTFTWDRQRAEELEKQWRDVGVPVKIGGPAYGDRMSPDFVPGRYLKQGYTFTSRGAQIIVGFAALLSVQRVRS